MTAYDDIPFGSATPQVRPPLSERDFMEQVMDLAELYGWKWLHIRPGMTRDSWRTPISGPLGKGWPDLLLCRPKDQRKLAWELKTDKGIPTAEQLDVLSFLEDCGFEVGVYRPRDWDALQAALR